jgi:beta-xylosidase
MPPTSTPTPFPPFREDFEQLLEEGWTWHYETRWGWNLHEKPGFLRIKVELDTHQILVRHAPKGDFEISTRVLFRPYSNFQSAGLIIFQDDGHWLSFHRGICTYTNIPEACQGNAIYYNHIDHDVGVPEEGYSIGPQFPTKTVEDSEAYLRLTREGRTYTAYYSDDGETWVIIGRHESDLFPFYVGIHTFGAETHLADADFDYFTLETLP